MKLAATRMQRPGAVWPALPVLGLLLGLALPVLAQAPPGPPGQMPTARPATQAPPAARAPQPATKPAAQPARPGGKKAPAPVLKRRDPFRSLLVRPDEMAGGQALPPGKRGLIIAQLTVNGVVTTPSEMIAVVTMVGRNRAYFLRERDELFNGTVGQITPDGVVFKEKTVDAFGKEYEREVVKQLSGSGAKR